MTVSEPQDGQVSNASPAVSCKDSHEEFGFLVPKSLGSEGLDIWFSEEKLFRSEHIKGKIQC